MDLARIALARPIDSDQPHQIGGLHRDFGIVVLLGFGKGIERFKTQRDQFLLRPLPHGKLSVAQPLDQLGNPPIQNLRRRAGAHFARHRARNRRTARNRTEQPDGGRDDPERLHIRPRPQSIDSLWPKWRGDFNPGRVTSVRRRTGLARLNSAYPTPPPPGKRSAPSHRVAAPGKQSSGLWGRRVRPGEPRGGRFLNALAGNRLFSSVVHPVSVAGNSLCLRGE